MQANVPSEQINQICSVDLLKCFCKLRHMKTTYISNLSSNPKNLYELSFAFVPAWMYKELLLPQRQRYVARSTGSSSPKGLSRVCSPRVPNWMPKSSPKSATTFSQALNFSPRNKSPFTKDTYVLVRVRLSCGRCQDTPTQTSNWLKRGR